MKDLSAYKEMCDEREYERLSQLTPEQREQKSRALDKAKSVVIEHRPIETMDIMDNRFRHVLYIGSPHKTQNNDLVVGRAYLIDEIYVGGSWSTIRLVGVDGDFNTVMFVEMPPNDPRAQVVTENMIVQWNSSLPYVKPIYPK